MLSGFLRGRKLTVCVTRTAESDLTGSSPLIHPREVLPVLTKMESRAYCQKISTVDPRRGVALFYALANGEHAILAATHYQYL